MNESYIFTFGINHLMRDYAIKITDTYENARRKMLDQFGKCWAFQYTEAEFEQDREKYFKNLMVLEV